MTDKDVGVNKINTFALDSSVFSVDNYTGIVRTETVLDREGVSYYNLTVTAFNSIQEVNCTGIVHMPYKDEIFSICMFDIYLAYF